MLYFNRSLTQDDIDYIQDYIFIWMQYCVFQDKLKRMESYVKDSNERVIQELMIKREWDVKKYPLWLVFEVEGGIQIRNEQYELIKLLMSEPNTIAQLNMGLGKTRVVLPCLCLAWSNIDFKRSTDSNLVRIFLLSNI